MAANFCKFDMHQNLLHRSFSPSEGLVRSFAEIVEISPCTLTIRIADLFHRGAAGTEFVCHDLVW